MLDPLQKITLTSPQQFTCPQLVRTGENHLAILYPSRYSCAKKYVLRSTNDFNRWLDGLKDAAVRRKVLARLARVENGNLGDFKQLAPALFELRFFIAEGLRVYCTLRGDVIVLLLTGGNKSSQEKDIARASLLLHELE